MFRNLLIGPDVAKAHSALASESVLNGGVTKLSVTLGYTQQLQPRVPGSLSLGSTC